VSTTKNIKHFPWYNPKASGKEERIEGRNLQRYTQRIPKLVKRIDLERKKD